MLTARILFAQNNNLSDFVPLKSSGNIPDDFRTLSTIKVEKEKEQIDKTDKHKTRKQKERFILLSNFTIDEILLSGKVLFNEEVSNYVNKVADNLLKDNPQLRKELHFYVTKTQYVNAFSTDKGIIFVNLGLIAQLENEAELAYILAHEIIHYVKKHNIEIFLENQEIYSNDNKKYKGLSIDDKYLASSYRSRENESEADIEGLKSFYLHSKYSISAVDKSFDVMQYSYLPFDELPFEKSFFETEYMKFPEKYFLKEVEPIKTGDNYDDSKSTHPNIRKRREATKLLTANESTEGKSDFILPKEDFLRIRNLARFEVLRQFIISKDYANAIYNSYILLKEFPENKYLESIIGYGLYALAIYKVNYSVGSVLEGYKKIEGESQQIFYFLNTLNKKEISSIALHYNWKLLQKNPNDKYQEKICDDLFNLLTKNCKMYLSDFSTSTKEEVKQKNENNDKNTDTTKLSKYEKIKRKTKNEEVKNDDNFISFAFVDLLKDKNFVDKFNEKQKGIDTKSKGDEDYNEESIAKNKEQRKAEKKQRRHEKNCGKSLGIDKILIVEPSYEKQDERKKDQIRYIDSELNQIDLNDRIKKNAEIAELGLNILDSKSFLESDIDKYNNMSQLKEWFSEQLKNTKNEVNGIIPFETKYINNITSKYQTKYACLIGFEKIRMKKDKVGWAVAGLFCFYTTLFSIPYLLKPENKTFFFNLLYNLETGENVFVEFSAFKSNDFNDLKNSLLYDTFHQIKNSKK